MKERTVGEEKRKRRGRGMRGRGKWASGEEKGACGERGRKRERMDNKIIQKGRE